MSPLTWLFDWELGLHRPLHVREEFIRESKDPIRVCYVSDIHLRPGRSHFLSLQILDACQRAKPDLILLGGDLVDRRTELGELRTLCERLNEMAQVCAVAGNHDESLGIERVRNAVISSGAVWLHDRGFRLECRGRSVWLSGTQDQILQRDRAADDITILCAHNPRIWKVAKQQGFDLILAGHLHGCQWVAFQFRNRLYPGAWFYPYCYLRHQERDATLVVSRGVSDLIPIRWRCPREVVLCYV